MVGSRIRDSRSGIWKKTCPGSRGQKGTGSRSATLLYTENSKHRKSIHPTFRFSGIWTAAWTSTRRSRARRVESWSTWFSSQRWSPSSAWLGTPASRPSSSSTTTRWAAQTWWTFWSSTKQYVGSPTSGRCHLWLSCWILRLSTPTQSPACTRDGLSRTQGPSATSSSLTSSSLISAGGWRTATSRGPSGPRRRRTWVSCYAQ